MEKRRWRHALALAAAGIGVAVVAAAALYVLFLLGVKPYLEGFYL